MPVSCVLINLEASVPLSMANHTCFAEGGWSRDHSTQDNMAKISSLPSIKEEQTTASFLASAKSDSISSNNWMITTYYLPPPFISGIFWSTFLSASLTLLSQASESLPGKCNLHQVGSKRINRTLGSPLCNSFPWFQSGSHLFVRRPGGDETTSITVAPGKHIQGKKRLGDREPQDPAHVENSPSWLKTSRCRQLSELCFWRKQLFFTVELEGLILNLRCDWLESKPLNYLQSATAALQEESNIFVRTDLHWDKSPQGKRRGGGRRSMETSGSKEARNPAGAGPDIIFFDTVDSRVCLRLKQKFHLFQTSVLEKKLDINNWNHICSICSFCAYNMYHNHRGNCMDSFHRGHSTNLSFVSSYQFERLFTSGMTNTFIFFSIV